ncbi:TPA: DUF1289 domain-containing protein [Raoultella planticola]|nr:DUF1289 domain-containing protein [Raoultella planticola]HAT1620044.1 DUF1289 domain-containing protein [Raoultella planticola]HAT1647399.1 DUF1289 domain-containing protein [Raoultella planticola]
MSSGAEAEQQKLRSRVETSSIKIQRSHRRRGVAEQLEFFPVQSPCRGICQSDERGFCRGCFRSREERFHWQTMSDVQKQDVLRLCRQRLLRKLRANKPQAEEEPQQPSLF